MFKYIALLSIGFDLRGYICIVFKHIGLSFIIFLLSCDDGKKVNNYQLSKIEATIIKKKLYKQYSEEILVDRLHEMENYVININDKEIKFDLKFFGTKPETGWELFFSLHGGGGVLDSVNENSWNRHKTLYSLKNGILLTPRSPTNTWNMWHQEHIDIFFNRLIQNMIAFHGVNSNKIYIMGYSAGGDGVYQIAPRMADRFAAAAMMAGHPNDANPLPLRNIGFTIHMGANDSAYNRNKVAIEWKDRLYKLRKNDTSAYHHLVKIHKNKGHWMGGLDTSAISWISKFTRNPFPRKVVWKQDDIIHERFYWLKVLKPLKNSLLMASITNQTIFIEKTSVSDFIIRLNDHLIDMDKNIIVIYEGLEIFNGIVLRNKNIIEKSIHEYGDLQSVYFGEIPISLDISR